VVIRRRWSTATGVGSCDAGRVRDRLLVTGQMVLLALLVVLPWVTDWSAFSAPVLRSVGYALVLLGGAVVVVAATHLGDALTAMPTPREGATLRTEGLYAFVRHPIYAGVLAIGWGLALRSELWLGVLLAVALTVLLHVKARYEESLLAVQHPGYPEYAARTARFVPRPRRRR
jgi:protein-S-isoprenylcysteine O-methyltransferase Ste14